MAIQYINNINKFAIVNGYTILKTFDDLPTARLYMAILRG